MENWPWKFRGNSEPAENPTELSWLEAARDWTHQLPRPNARAGRERERNSQQKAHPPSRDHAPHQPQQSRIAHSWEDYRVAHREILHANVGGNLIMDDPVANSRSDTERHDGDKTADNADEAPDYPIDVECSISTL
jgi:hypothetical protein